MHKFWTKIFILILLCCVSLSVFANGLAEKRYEEAVLLYKGYKKEKQQHVLEMALAYTKNAIEFDDDDYRKFLLLGFIYNEMSNNLIAPSLALEAFDDAVSLNPNDASLRLAIAEDLYKKGRYSYAVKFFEDILRMDNALLTPELTGLLLDCYVKASEENLGIAFLKKLINNYEYPPAYLLLSTAILLKNECRYEESLEYLDRVGNNMDFSEENREYARKLTEKIKAHE